MTAIPQKVYIWGGGLIGYTLAQSLAGKGIATVILDVDAKAIERINQGLLPRGELKELMEEMDDTKKHLISARPVKDFVAPQESALHFLSVPTERQGNTFYEPTAQVLEQITQKSNKSFPVYLIAESTISPNWFDDIHAAFQKASWTHGKNYHVGASPRRDVFNSDDLRMKNVDKIIGGDSDDIIPVMHHIYEGITGLLHQAPDSKHAMLTKIVENFLRDSALNTVNSLASVFPEYNMARIFDLASTKWNIEKYHPSLGIGGYCIPLAKKYITDATANKATLEKLGHLDSKGTDLIASLESFFAQHKIKSLAILGLAYGPSFKVHTHSPTFEIIKRLTSHVDDIVVHDPFYTQEEITHLTGCQALSTIDKLSVYDAVLFVTPHPYYVDHKQSILEHIQGNDILLIDNLGTFKKDMVAHAKYWEIGTPPPVDD